MNRVISGSLLLTIVLVGFESNAQELSGTWRLESADIGVETDETLYVEYRFTFADGELAIRERDGKPSGVYALGSARKYQIDQKETPWQIDFSEDSPQGRTTRGIYRIDGDTLTLSVCFRQRPLEFKAARDPRRGQNHVAVYVLKRADD